MKLKIKVEKVIAVQDWDKFVSTTYGRPYCFQQQDGCKERGMFRFKVPLKANDYANDTMPEDNETVCIGGVSFSAWLKRDPKQPLERDICGKDQWAIDLWWERNFYPEFQMVANDLHAKGLLAAGEYVIDIDW